MKRLTVESSELEVVLSDAEFADLAIGHGLVQSVEQNGLIVETNGTQIHRDLQRVVRLAAPVMGLRVDGERGVRVDERGKDKRVSTVNSACKTQRKPEGESENLVKHKVVKLIMIPHL